MKAHQMVGGGGQLLLIVTEVNVSGDHLDRGFRQWRDNTTSIKHMDLVFYMYVVCEFARPKFIKIN